jgi:putative heme-binding domain-containing protein
VALRLDDARERLASWVETPQRASAVRVRALEALGQLGIAAHVHSLRAALADGDANVRAAALFLLPRVSPSEALPILTRILSVGETSERRAAYRALGSMTGAEVEQLLAAQLELARAGLIPAELALDLVLACRALDSQRLNEQLAERESLRASDPALAPFLDSLFGGHAARGQGIFERRADLSCLRCHLSGADAASGVGQDLRGIGERLTRLQLLEAVVDPNRRIAPGFESELVVLDDESVHVGRVLDEDDRLLNMISAEGETVAIEKSHVISRRPTLSAMPEGLAVLLSPEQMRDLIEYLARR